MYKVLEQNQKEKSKLVRRNAFILRKMMLKEFLLDMQADKKLLTIQRSSELEREFDIYYRLDSKFLKRLEKSLDNYNFVEISYLESRLLVKKDETSRLMSRVLELYLYTKMI